MAHSSGSCCGFGPHWPIFLQVTPASDFATAALQIAYKVDEDVS